MKLVEERRQLGIEVILDAANAPVGTARMTQLPFGENMRICWSFSEDLNVS